MALEIFTGDRHLHSGGGSRLLVKAILILSICSQAEVFAGEVTTPYRMNFDYRAELGLIYLDEFDPGKVAQSIHPLQTGPAEQTSSSYRSFGLRQASIDLLWTHLRSAELGLRLRPDASLSRHEAVVTRELDTRSGQTYRPAPPIELLDSYHMAITPGEDFRFGWGVFESFESDRMAYETSLEFGLEARLPKKFASYFISWGFQPLDTPRLAPTIRDHYRFTFWLYEGREDRRELVSASDVSADQGPAAQDPYLNGAISLEARPNEFWRYSLIAGYGDTKLELGRVSEMFASLATDWQTKLGQQTVRFHWQSQWSKERWRVTGLEIRGLQQISHSLSSRIQLHNPWQLLAGAHWGMAQNHVENLPGERAIQNGQQFDFGLEYHQGNHLRYQVMLASEIRSLTELGQRRGAFIVEDNPQRRLNRIAFAVNYRIQ